MRTGVGDIVQVEGGHIVRSTGRKDRHSKVYTSKGPRDRRVRLSAHTAIEFYDVQDRLGYDRPSKAVDWLIKKAKTSIDRLAELPPWHPPTHEEEKQNDAAGSSGIIAIAQQQQQHEQQSESCGYNFQLQRQLGPSVQPMLTLTPSIFKPTTPQKILAYPSIASKTTLASFIGNHNRQVHIKHLLQMNTKSEPFLLAQPQPFIGQGSTSAYAQSGGTLQSSFSFPMTSPSELHRPQPVNQPSIFDSRFVSDGLADFCIPDRIQGVEENHGVASNRPSSSPSSIH
eukprot:XP_025980446.1 transcription factor TCP4 [Glycine max]